jgi:ATP-dependent Clp protease ATP-binding subunit ClpC
MSKHLRKFFTPRAERALEFACEDAKNLNHCFVGTEHFLQGVLKLEIGVAYQWATQNKLNCEVVHIEAEKQFGAGKIHQGVKHIKYSPAMFAVMRHAKAEAKALDHRFVGAEHLLLSILMNEDCIAAKVLHGLGIDLVKARREVHLLMDPRYGGT